jgi:hypothetical protein
MMNSEKQNFDDFHLIRCFLFQKRKEIPIFKSSEQDWRFGSSGTVPALKAWSLEFKHESHQKKF